MISLRFDTLSPRLPTSLFDVLSDGEKVGEIQVRHRVSAGAGVPSAFASHIYYGIDEPHRGKGYAQAALALALREARRIGLENVIVCCYTSNPASQRVIEKNGGIFQAQGQDDEGYTLRKYVFPLTQDIAA